MFLIGDKIIINKNWLCKQLKNSYGLSQKLSRQSELDSLKNSGANESGGKLLTFHYFSNNLPKA